MFQKQYYKLFDHFLRLHLDVFVLSAGSIERRRIKDALSYWEELTCVTFIENSKAQFKLVFVKQSGQVSLYSYI